MDKMSETEPPYPHQLEAVKLAEPQDNFALFFRPGAGKTRPVIRIAVNKYKKLNRNLRTLILTPPVVVEQFRKEWFKYTNVEREKVVALVGSQKKRIADFLTARYMGAKIFITNYEALNMADLFKELLAWQIEMLVLDESHSVKNPNAKRSRRADELANPYNGKIPLPRPFVYLMSGTPVLGSPMDIFMQFKIMDGGETFGNNYYAFKARYFRDRNAGMPSHKYFPKWELMNLKQDGFDAAAEIQAKIKAKAIYADVDKYLPPESYVEIKVPMTPEQARAYKEMKADLVTQVQSGTASVNLAITKALRLMQIASGFLSVDDDPEREEQGVKHEFKDTPKQEALAELLTEITESGAKVLVWAVWKQNYEQIKQVCETLKLKYVEVHGGISQKDKDKNVDLFNSDPDCRVYIGHPRSGGIGLNLTAATYDIFYSRTFSLEHYEQAKRRNWRGGQTKPVVHYSLVCENTLDEDAVKALANKQDMSDRLIKEIILSGP